MLQNTGNIPVEQQYLAFAPPKIHTSKSTSLVTGRKPGPAGSENLLFEKVSPFYYRNRVSLSFSVSKDFHMRFVLIKGLIEFNRSKNVSFRYDIKQKTIQTNVSVTELDDLHNFLAKVLVWLQEEIQFRDTLKVALALERRYKAEMGKIYKNMQRINSRLHVANVIN